MIIPYVRPQDTITQILQQTAQRLTSRRNPIVIGPQYTLFLNDGRDLTAAYRDFVAAGEEDLEYTDTLGVAIDLDLLKPHTASAELRGSKLNALVGTIARALMTLDATDQTARRFRIGTDTLAGSGDLNAALEGRKVKVGDIISADWAKTDATIVLTTTNVLAVTTTTVTIGNRTYTLKTTLTAGNATANEVLLGVDGAATLANLRAAVNGLAGGGSTYGSSTTPHTQVVAGAVVGLTLTFTASGSSVTGSAGNALTGSDATSATLTWSNSGAFTGGLDGTTKRTVVGLLGVVTASSYVDTEVGVLNPTTQAADAAVSVAANTTSGLDVNITPTIAAADEAILRAAGKVTLVSSAYKLSDTLDLTCVTGGAPGVATFNITSLATGITAPSPVTSSGSGTNFTVALTTAGYTGATPVMVTKGSAMVAGDKIRITLLPAFTPEDDLVVTGTYTGTVDRRYAVEVTDVEVGVDIDLNIFDVAGNDPAVSHAGAITDTDLAVGTSGLLINPLDLAGFAKGQIFYIDATAAVASTTEFDGVTLDGPLVPSINVEAAGAVEDVVFDEVRIYQVYSGVLDARHTESIDPALVASADDWDYAADLGLPSSLTGRNGAAFSPFADAIGSVYLSYKALVIPLPTEAMISINREVDIVTKVGETSFDNWLGRGALEAFRGNQNRVVYALRTGGDTVEDFTTALRKIQTTDRVYALVGMTDSLDVMLLLRDHCNTQSNKYNKNFRRAYVGTDSPGAYVHWGALPGGGYRTGVLLSSNVTLDEEFRAAWKFLPSDVGSTIHIQAIGLTFTITAFISDYEVETDASNLLPEQASNLILTRADTPGNTARYVNDRSTTLSSRRIVNVWSDDPTVTENGATTVVPMKFIAAEIAGLRCALLPQQGLTMTEILSATAAPSMFTTFEPETLDEISANGTFVVTQESEGGDVFVRHQLTTSTDEGALAYEDNVGVIVDEFAYAVKDSFREYVGRRNATPDTILEIDNKLKKLALSFTQVDLANRKIGPAVLSFFDEKGVEGEVTVRQDGDLADTLMTYVKLRVPLPLNGLNHYIDVEATELLASPDNVTA
jgi:hypothetical protein